MDDLKSVLVAAGDRELKGLVCAALEEAGFEVRSASGAHEALLLTSAYRPRAVVLAATLDDGDGYRLSRTIKTRHWQGEPHEPPRVLLLADHKIEHDADIERMFRDFSKADVVIDSPFEPASLIEKLRAGIGDPDSPKRRMRKTVWGRAGRLA